MDLGFGVLGFRALGLGAGGRVWGIRVKGIYSCRALYHMYMHMYVYNLYLHLCIYIYIYIHTPIHIINNPTRQVYVQQMQDTYHTYVYMYICYVPEYGVMHPHLVYACYMFTDPYHLRMKHAVHVLEVC